MQCHRHAAQSNFSGVRAGIVGFDSLPNLKIVFFRINDDRLLVSFLFSYSIIPIRARSLAAVTAKLRL